MMEIEGNGTAIMCPKAGKISRSDITREWRRARLTRAHEQTIALANRLLDISPDKSAVRRPLARLLVELGKTGEALPHWQYLASSSTDDFEAAYFVAKTMVADGTPIAVATVYAAPAATGIFRQHLIAVLETPPAIVAATHHVAIAGVGYSGSTILDRVLGSLPGTRSCGESHWLTKSREKKPYGPASFADAEEPKLPACNVCGRNCEAFPFAFRRALAAEPTDWYGKLAARLCKAPHLISSDKGPNSLIELDPLLRMDALVLYKTPEQAWHSTLKKLPRDRDADYFVEACRAYAGKWSRTYRVLLDDFSPDGRRGAICFDTFANEPARGLRSITDHFDLPYSDEVLHRAQPGHAIGGNGAAVTALREAGNAVTIRPLAEPVLPATHRAILAEDTDVQTTLADLQAASLLG